MTLDYMFNTVAIGSTIGVIGYIIVLFVFGIDEMKGNNFQVITVLLGNGLVGAAVGEISGLSRVGVAGEVVPAIMTIMGALSIYMFGQQKSVSPVVNISFLLFVLSCFFSYNFAAVARSEQEVIDFCRTQYAETIRSNAKDALKNFDQLFGEQCSKIGLPSGN